MDWISVDERLPDNVHEHLVYMSWGGYDVGYYDEGNGWRDYNRALLPDVTHWMPLPGPPEDDD